MLARNHNIPGMTANEQDRIFRNNEASKRYRESLSPERLAERREKNRLREAMKALLKKNSETPAQKLSKREAKTLKKAKTKRAQLLRESAAKKLKRLLESVEQRAARLKLQRDASARHKLKNPKVGQAYVVQRRKTDLNFRLASVLRGRMSRGFRAGSAVRDLGCSIHEFKIYIEAQFTAGMNWSNYGRTTEGVTGWELDHRTPLTYFDLAEREQFLQACHYSNYQPLWRRDNIIKGNRWADPPGPFWDFSSLAASNDNGSPLIGLNLGSGRFPAQ